MTHRIAKRIFVQNLNSGLPLNCHSACLTTWKFDLIMCFLHRAKCICFNYSYTKKKLKNYEYYFQKKNTYPNWFINKIVTKFEDRNFCNTNDCNLGNWQKMEKKL